ncbi:MAG TPA: hypothetical protein PK767_02705 [Clostridiales bacterium]|nr:hypothetical protein [Clostridiales bacterium]HOL91357.1 hypothetical protein [Clostridiales bacterium]HPP35137.1 hypothetical protein [Clostridiales bacterium]
MGYLQILCRVRHWQHALYTLHFSVLFPDASAIEMLIVYIGTSFFLSTLGVLVSFLSRQPHLPAVVCGIAWLLSLLLRAAFMENLVRLPVIGCFYPFIRFAAPGSSLWVMNKAVLFLLGAGMWAGVYFVCRKRKLML